MYRFVPVLILGCLLLACSDSQGPDSLRDAQGQAGGIENRGSGTDNWWDALPRPQWSEFEQLESADPWFEVYRIRDNIYALYEPGQFEEVISYLITGEKRALLFDTGLGFGNIRKVVKALTSKPVIVVNSHAHYDHVGGNHLFPLIWGLENSFSGKRSRRGLPNAVVAQYAAPAWVWKELPQNFDPARYRIKPWEYGRWLEDGQFIDLGGISLEVIHTPGHSPDSICLLDHQNRQLFTGDTFYLAPLYAHIEGASFEAYQASAARLAELGGQVDTLLMTHNVPVASADYLQALDQAFSAIASGQQDFETSDGTREYRFQGFSILTEDPP